MRWAAMLTRMSVIVTHLICKSSLIERRPVDMESDCVSIDSHGAGDRGRTGDAQFGKGAEVGASGKPEDESPCSTRIF
jgi:hypothetical protein